MGKVAAIAAIACICADAAPAAAYSVLAHEAIVDGAWDAHIRPLLAARFPRATADDFVRARGYAYGGSVIQDLGYYPFGDKFFSNLLHYVRSGEFVEALIAEAGDLNEYAFALGALAHYEADTTGHPEAINLAVPILFPKLRARFGDRVTYVQAPAQHVIVEFSFDVVQAAAGAYGPEAYTRFLAFEVAGDLLARAFRDTYGLELTDVCRNLDEAIGTYRFGVSQLIPSLTKAAWKNRREEIERLIPGVEEKSFVFGFSRGQYEEAYGTAYRRPGWLARFLAFLYRLVPKIGPLKPLGFETPTPGAQALFVDSLAAARARFVSALDRLRTPPAHLRNTDFDTGQPTRHGEYALADDTYAELTETLAEKHFTTAPGEMLADLVAFYEHARLPSGDGTKERKHWDALQRALSVLAEARNRSKARPR